MSNSAIRESLGRLRECMEFAVGNQLVTINPCLLAEVPWVSMNTATHIDFLLYNRISKKLVLAIKVDGYDYHKKDTIQASRDMMKNHILQLYDIPLLRFKTNGRGEKEKIEAKLEELVG